MNNKQGAYQSDMLLVYCSIRIFLVKNLPSVRNPHLLAIPHLGSLHGKKTPPIQVAEYDTSFWVYSCFASRPKMILIFLNIQHGFLNIPRPTATRSASSIPITEFSKLGSSNLTVAVTGTFKAFYISIAIGT